MNWPEFFGKNWVWLVILGDFLVAASSIVAKINLAGTVSKPIEPRTYAFFTGIGGLVPFLAAIVLQPFSPILNFGFFHAAAGLIGGGLFIWSLWLFYLVLEGNETSRVTTVMVAAVPLATFILKYSIFSERLSMQQVLAFVLLVVGGAMIAFKQVGRRNFTLGVLVGAALAGFGFACGTILAELAFHLGGFVSGIFWITGGYGLGALLLLLPREGRNKIFEIQNTAAKGNITMFFAEKVSGLTGATLTKFAVSLVSATLVNALEGTKQFFVLIMAAILSFRYPRILKEELRGIVLWQKILATAMVAAGIFLFIYAG